MTTEVLKPDIRGYYRLDPRLQTLRGWVCNLNQPNKSECVEVLIDGQIVANCRANKHRGDLFRLGTGDQNYGFEYPLSDLSLESGTEYSIAVRVKGSETPLEGNSSYFTFCAAKKATLPALKIDNLVTGISHQETQTVAIDCSEWQGSDLHFRELIGLVRNGADESRYFHKNSGRLWSYRKKIVDAVFRDALVIIPLGIVIVDGKVVFESTYLANFRSTFPILSQVEPTRLQTMINRLLGSILSRSTLDKYDLRLILNSVTNLQGSTFLLSSCRYQSYYHWHIDTLPNVTRMARANSNLPDRILCSAPPTKWHKASLELLQNQYPLQAPLYFTEGLQVLQVDELQYTSGLGGNRSFLSPDIGEFYNVLTRRRNQFSRPPDIGEHVYLSRKSESRRRLVNEDEIERMLEARGFNIINPSDFDYETQIGIFQRAKTVVAPHGAALTNILFCQDRVRVL